MNRKKQLALNPSYNVIRITSKSGKMENNAHPPMDLKYTNSLVVASWVLKKRWHSSSKRQVTGEKGTL